MITQVFTTKGMTLSVAEAYTRLIALNPGDPYAREKAAGSLGGSSRHGFIQFNLANKTWTRVR